MKLQSIVGLIVSMILMDVCSIQAGAEITAKNQQISVQQVKPVPDLRLHKCSPLLQPRGPWQKLGNPLTESSYAAGHWSTDIKLVVVDRNGDLQGATIGTNRQSDHFSDSYVLHGESATLWSPITGASVSKFKSQITPVILEQTDNLWLLVAGMDDNLHVFKTDFEGQWVHHRKITTKGDVKGRISAAISNSVGSGSPDLHVVYSTDTGIKYLRVASESQRKASKVFDQYKEGVVGSNGQNLLFFAFRTNSKIEFYITTSNTRRISLRLINGPFTAVAVNSVVARKTAVTDLSNVEFLGNDFHLLYTEKTSTALTTPAVPATTKYQLKHLRFVGPQLNQYVGQTVSNFLSPREAPANPQTNQVTGDRTSRLKVYRHHLLAAMTEVNGQLRYARWEYANYKKPWIVGLIGAESLSKTRPSLVEVNARPGLSKNVGGGYDYDHPHIGYDLLTAVASDCGGYLANLSREIFKKELAANHSTYSGLPIPNTSFNPAGYLNDQSVPAITEAGLMYWSLPSPFTKDRAVNLTRRNCTCPEGEVCPPGSPNWPEDSEACQSERLPIKLKYFGGIFVFRGQINLFHDHYGKFFEEFGHYVVSDIGLRKPNGVITDDIAHRAGISVRELQKGQAIFREGLSTESSACEGRCPGFVNNNNYDLTSNNSGSMEHASLYPLLWYFWRGDDLRALMNLDLDAQVNPPEDKYTLLSRKYEWIKKNIFNGVEFGNDSAPR
jgi:hypothetical protein